MDPNKLYCQANKAIIEELDGRVAALEQGGGGTEYTAGTGIDITEDVISVDSETIYDKTDVDELLGEKQDVLTAGDGVKIENDTISVKEWHRLSSVTKSEIISSSNTLLKDILLEVHNYETNFPLKIRMYKGDYTNATVADDNVDVSTGTGKIIDTDYRFEAGGETLHVRRYRNILTLTVDSSTQNVTGNISTIQTLMNYSGTGAGADTFSIWVRD